MVTPQQKASPKARSSALLICALAILAGCVGPEDPVVPTSEATNTSGVTNETTSPLGTSISAFNETNKTETTGVGAMIHEHDYWNGKERLDDVMWIDAGLIPLPLTPCARPDNACTLGGSTPGTDTYPPLTTIADFDFEAPPKMGMVYEGTKTIEVTMKNFTGPAGAPANPTGHVYFDYLAANDEPGKFHKGGELKLGEPFRIDIKPTDADMPHQTKSLWVFRIYSDSTMVWFEFNITVSLVKGYDVVNWPPHPNLYADRAERIVFDGPVKLASKGSVDGLVFGSDAGWTSPQKVISWGTDTVDIEISNVVFSSQAPIAPAKFELHVRNASSPALMANFPNWAALEDPGSDGKNYHFAIDLTEDRGDAMDTPYAQYSRWGFRLIPTWDDTTGCLDPYMAGCQWYPWDLTYTMRIIARGHSTSEGVPDSAATPN